MALFRYATKDELANLKLAPRQEQTKMFDTLGRNSGSRNSSNSNSGGNLFTKKANSFENAFGTTGAALYETRGDLLGAAIAGLNGSDYQSASSKEQNEKTANLLKNADQGERDILSKYGYNNRDEYYDKLDSLEAAGDTEAYNNLVNTVGAEIRDLYSGVKQKQEQTRDKYDDYVANNYASQKINQDRGKFLGSAINTLSTMSDVMLPGAGVAFNAIQGGVEGIADELEENGLENFDWGRAGQNALIGATTGAVTGALNKGISSKLAQNGGNLFKGGNKLTQAINNAGSNTALGRVGSTLATGVARGAASGAVGGATGAGLSAALNGQDVLGSAIQGAQQGLGQGAMAGGVMAGANMLASKTPGVGTAMQKFNEAGEDWSTRKANGESFGERLANTWDESTTKAIGDKVANSRLGNRIGEDINAVKQGFQDVGQGLGTLARRGMNAITDSVDNTRANMVNRNAKDRLAVALTESVENAANGGVSGNTKFVRLTNDKLNDINTLRVAQGLAPLEQKQVIAYENAINNGLNKRLKQGGMAVDDVVNMAYESLVSPNAEALPGNAGSANTMMVAPYEDRYDGSMIDNFQGTTSLKSIEPRSANKVNTQRAIKNDLLGQPGSPLVANQEGGVTQASSLEGSTSLGGETAPLRTLTSNIPQNDQNVNTSLLAYGESDLANRTRRGMVADGLERLGNTLEGAQTNVTRASAKDLGIESTGKVVENVRKKTGITNLETQAQLARELTGGEKSLMDNIQRTALSSREGGGVYRVDTTPVLGELENIVNKYADTNMFGSKEAKERFINNLKTDIANMDTDVLGISNRMKSNAADLRGKGVTSPTPTDSAKAKIYTEVANKLDDLSYKAIPQENVEAMFDKTIFEMRGRANRAAQNGNNDVAKAYNRLADNLDAEPRTIKAYRSFKKDFVDVSKINELTARAENGAAAQMGRSFGGGLKRFASTVVQRPVNAALAKAGGVINSVANRIDGERTVAPTAPVQETAVLSNNNPATQIYNMIGRTEGLNNAEQARTADYLVNAAQEAEIVPSDDAMKNAGSGAIILPNGTASTSVYNALTGGNANGQVSNSQSSVQSNSSYFPSTGDYWTDILGNAMSAAIEADDATAFAQLYAMYQEQLSNLKKNSSKDGSDLTSWSGSDRSKLLSAQNAMDQIDQLESAYNSATGGNGGNFLQGNLRSLAANLSGGNLDASANNYNKLAESVGMGIVKNLINLGVTEADAQRYLEYLPALTDTKEQAAQKLETLRNIYQSQINNLYSAYGV